MLRTAALINAIAVLFNALCYIAFARMGKRNKAWFHLGLTAVSLICFVFTLASL